MAWKARLPERLRVSLEALLDSVNSHEEAFGEAENASLAQMWTAMALMHGRIERLEELVTAQRKALNSLDLDMDSRLEDDLEDSLRNY